MNLVRPLLVCRTRREGSGDLGPLCVKSSEILIEPLKSQNGQLELFSHVITYPTLLYILLRAAGEVVTKILGTRVHLHLLNKVETKYDLEQLSMCGPNFSSPLLWKVIHCPDWIHLT